MTVATGQASTPLRRIDRVWAASALILLAVLALDRDLFLVSLEFLATSWLWTLPFVLVSAVLAASIAATALDRPLGESLRRRAVQAVLIAGVLGALSPFCSVSVVPLVAGLLAAGVPLAPVMAFWVGSPLIDPEMFVLTAGIIDLPFALVRTGTAIVSGLLAGFADAGTRPPCLGQIPSEAPRPLRGSGHGLRHGLRSRHRQTRHAGLLAGP